jgi:RNA polymerase sigma factor (sigma-70 family)
MAHAFQPPPTADQLRRTVQLNGVASRDVDDIVPNIRIRLWQKSSLVNAADSPSAYALGAAKDAARGYRRRARRHPEEDLMGFGDVELCDSRPNPEEQASAREALEIVAGFIDQIDEKFRHTFIARVCYGETIADIAEAAGIGESTVEKRLRIAHQQFEAAYKR